MTTYKLSIDLIPESNWGFNLAHILKGPLWDVVRREVYKKFDYTCCECNATNEQMHCHEQWVFDDKKHIQFLKGFKCLCKKCHDIHHWGRTIGMLHKGTYTSEYVKELVEHFCRVNECTLADFDAHKVLANEHWRARSRYSYKVDFGKFTPERIEKEYLKGKIRG
jgi:hypothetical protein